MLKGSGIQPCLRVCTVATLALLSAGSAAAVPIQYLVGVDTSSVSGAQGFLDFQFNPVNGTSQAAIATISSFSGGTLGSPPQVTGSVSGGPLPAPLTITNDTPLNDVFQPFTYGNFFSFVLSLSGPALSSPDGSALAGSTFGVGLYDSTGVVAILTNQSGTVSGTGFAGSVDVNLDGTTTVTLFPTASGGHSVVTFQVISVPGTVPEPGSLLLFTFGGAALILLRKILR